VEEERVRESEELLRQKDGEGKTGPFKRAMELMRAIKALTQSGRKNTEKLIPSMFKRTEFTGENGSLSKVHRIAEMKIHK